MKILNGQELAEFIKVRQERQVRSFQHLKVVPKLLIIQTKDDPIIDTYVRLKERYGQDIGVEVAHQKVSPDDIQNVIMQANKDDTIHGIIVQLPLHDDITDTQALLDTVDAQKDVDGLASNSIFTAATPTAIQWLLNGYNVELRGKSIVVIGNGRLVGKPLSQLLIDSGYQVTTIDKSSAESLAEAVPTADIIITATGKAGLVTSDLIKDGAVVVDAGVSVEEGTTKGDLADDIYNRSDLTITPQKGGVGPLTVCALFENVITSARNAVSN